MTTITETRYVQPPIQLKMSCCERFCRVIDTIKRYVCAFFRWLFCCEQKASGRILQAIQNDPTGGADYVEKCNRAAGEVYFPKFWEIYRHHPLMGFVNSVPGQYDLWMGGVALTIAHLKKKYGFKDFYACETLEGFSKKLDAFIVDPSTRRGAFIVPCIQAGTQEFRGIDPNFPQHKVAVLVEKDDDGRIKLAITDAQSNAASFVSPKNVEGHAIWDGWKEKGSFDTQELILRAVLQAPHLPADTQLFHSTVTRERAYGCAHYAIQDGVAFLRDPDFFNKMEKAPIYCHVSGVSVQRIVQLPPACMIGTQSLKQLDAYSHKDALVKPQKGKTLGDYRKKYEVNGRNHYITVKVRRYYEIVLQMLATKTHAEINQSLAETLVK